jgi:DNA-binding MarR family transcriptional regulator
MPGTGRKPRIGDALVLEHFLPYRLVVLASTVSRALGTVYEERFGVTIAEWRVIANIGHRGALTAGEVAQHSSMDKAKVTRALRSLAQRGLITRTVGASDRRQARIDLTVRGGTLFRDIGALALEWEQELVAALPREDRAALSRILETLTEQAGAMLLRAKRHGGDHEAP